MSRNVSTAHATCVLVGAVRGSADEHISRVTDPLQDRLEITCHAEWQRHVAHLVDVAVCHTSRLPARWMLHPIGPDTSGGDPALAGMPSAPTRLERAYGYGPMRR